MITYDFGEKFCILPVSKVYKFTKHDADSVKSSKKEEKMNKILKITLALMMVLGLQLTSLNAVNALNGDLSKVGTYQIPIKSLTSSAPMPAVKTAFAKAFGDTLEVTVDKDGKMQAVATLQNMIINMGSEYYLIRRNHKVSRF